MLRTAVACFAVLGVWAVSSAAPVPKDAPRLTGVLVLDNCDPKYDGKDEYADNLTLLDPAGKQRFRVSGFNNCESIGSSRMVAADPARKCIWTIENVANRLRRFDLTGRETLCVKDVSGSAVAVDAATGNVWALVGPGQIGKGHIAVFDGDGKEVATYAVSGWDMVYDPKAKAFWVADTKLTKLDAATGKVLFAVDVSTWCAASLDVDPVTGCAWVAVRDHPDVRQSKNRLLRFDPDGKELAAVELGGNGPRRVSVDRRDGGAWAACSGPLLAKYSADGKRERALSVDARAVQVDPATGDVWAVTPEETQRLSPKGEVLKATKHAGTTSQAWVVALE